MDATILRRAVEQVDRLQPELGWLREVRQGAVRRLVDEGLPSTTQEDWRYTDLTPVAKLVESPSLVPGATVPDAALAQLIVPGVSRTIVVLAAGTYRADLSSIPVRPGLTVTRLGQAPPSMQSSLAGRIGQATTGFGSLAALNSALVRDGLVVEVAPDTELEEPLYVVVAGPAAGGASFNRLFVRIGAGSRATVIEHHVSVGDGLSNTMTELACERDSRLTYVKLQAESASAIHLASQHVVADRGARADVLHLDLGARLARNDLHVELSGAGAEALLHGLFFADGSAHLDNHTRIDHRAPHTRSRELYRGVADGRGRGVFNGKVIVHSGAIKTDASLTNQNLLLSRTAEVDTKPELEIYTDDVKCSHGATTGQLDANSIFYLRSRGIPAAEARRMLIASFVREIVGRVPSAPLGAHVVSLLHGRLPEMKAMTESL